MENNSLVSVIIPSYNRRDTIVMAIHSVQIQTYKNLEIIVVDDGSTDDTMEIINKIRNQDPRLFLFQHEKNKGANAARNTGIGKAHGEYIAFLDSDDEWLPNKISKQLNVFNSNSNVDIVFTGYYERGYPSKKISRKWIPSNSTKLSTLYCENYLGTTSSVMYKSSVLRQSNGFNENLPSAQDWDLYLRTVNSDNFYIIEEPLLNHMHPDKGCGNRISGNIQKKIDGLLFILKEVEELVSKGAYSDEKNAILCRLHYKLAKMYFEREDYKGALLELSIAHKYKKLDLRVIKLFLKLKLK